MLVTIESIRSSTFEYFHLRTASSGIESNLPHLRIHCVAIIVHLATCIAGTVEKPSSILEIEGNSARGIRYAEIFQINLFVVARMLQYRYYKFLQL